jgi:ABC-2 type transport system ATP-binding protein
VVEGTPAQLKSQVGLPHLELALADADLERAAAEVCGRFGRPLPSKDGKVLVELEGGATQVATVVRALDDAGIAVESLDLVQPTLDDVFVARTGHHLEPADEEGGETAEHEAAPA